MSTETKAPIPDRIPCETCLKEVPGSEAVIAEATDYVAYFCGLDCYEKWKKDTGNEDVPAQLPKP